MPITAKILIPLSDGVDVTGLKHVDIFESIAEHIRNESAAGYDDFNDNSIDGAKWTEVDSGTNISEVNQRIEAKGNGSWNANGLVSKTAFVKTTGSSYLFTIVPPVNNQSIAIIHLAASTSLTVSGQSFGIWLVATGDIFIYINGTNPDTGYNYVGGKTYTFTIVYRNPGWFLYCQSPDDSNFTEKTLIYQTVTDSTGTLYFQANFYTATASSSYLDDVGPIVYPASVSPAAVWNAHPVGTKIKWSTARVVIEKSGVIQAATSTDWKCQKAINNGVYNGTWLTLSALRALSDDTVTDATYSVNVKGQWNSDTTYETLTTMYMVVDIEYPSNGGVFCLID